MRKQLYKLINGKLVIPPVVGTKKNGETVSGYNRMAKHKLRADGWKDLKTDTAPDEIPEGFELVWYFEQDDNTIYHRCRLEKLILEDEIYENE